MKYTKEKIQRELKKWSDRLKELQTECDHLGHDRDAGYNIGHLDPQDDMYWWDCECHLCGKMWREDQ